MSAKTRIMARAILLIGTIAGAAFCVKGIVGSRKSGVVWQMHDVPFVGKKLRALGSNDRTINYVYYYNRLRVVYYYNRLRGLTCAVSGT